MTDTSNSKRRIMVEFAQPNTHKDFHVGHLRNASIGQAIANLLEFQGHTVYKATYIGDVGKHVAKAVWGEKHLASEKARCLVECKKRVFEILTNLPPKALWETTRDPGRYKAHIDAVQRIYSLDDYLCNYRNLLNSTNSYIDLLCDSDVGNVIELPTFSRIEWQSGDSSPLQYWAKCYSSTNLLQRTAYSPFETSYEDRSPRADQPFVGYAARLMEEYDYDAMESGLLNAVQKIGQTLVGIAYDLEDYLNEWLRAWENKDTIVRDDWLESRDECVSAFRAIFDQLKLEFTTEPDLWFYESTIDDMKLGQQTAQELLSRGIAEIDDSEEYKGSMFVDFEKQADALKDDGTPVFRDDEKKKIRKLGKMVILRSDGTSLYQTKELGLAKHKFDLIRESSGSELQESLYVVGAEQKLYFQQVLAILRLWGFPNAENCRHIDYELVVLPEGKMSSRAGSIVSYRDLRDEAIRRAEETVREKGIITDETQIRETAKAIAIAAIKYTMLQVSGSQQIVFDFEQALSFSGRSAPYLQYAYARAGKLIEGNEAQSVADKPGYELNESELAMARLLSMWPGTARRSAEKYEPAFVCTYLYDLASAFSDFYRDCRVLGEPPAQMEFRRGIVTAFRNVMRLGFRLLALPLPEAM